MSEFMEFFRKQFKVKDDSSRKTILESSGVPAVCDAIHEFISALGDRKDEVLLIGGLAYGVYCRPRSTQDIDVLLHSDSLLDKVMMLASRFFKKTRSHAMVHKTSGVELEVLTPGHLKLPPGMIDAVFASAEIHEISSGCESKMKVPSPSGLIALKLLRGVGTSLEAEQDRLDIKRILSAYPDADVASYRLEEKHVQLFQKLASEVQKTS